MSTGDARPGWWYVENGTVRHDPPIRSCERYNRNHGGVYKILCDICRRGPCEHDAYKDARDVPNRLHGAAINAEGCAI